MALPRTIAIDGPAGGGESTHRAPLAQGPRYLVPDTGAVDRGGAAPAAPDGVAPVRAPAPSRRPHKDLLQEILRRDQLDTERAVSPLKAAEDAIVVQTDGLSVREALDRVLAAIQRP